MLVRKKKKGLVLFLLIIISGVLFYFIFNIYNFVFSIYNLSEFRERKEFKVNHVQGFGILNSILILYHSLNDAYNGHLYFQTSCSGEIEDFGITELDIDIYRDNIYQTTIKDTINGSSGNCHYSFPLSDIYEDHVVSCQGEVKTEFNVEGVILNKTIIFTLSVKLPKDLIQKRYDLAIALRWTHFGLIVGELTAIGFIINIWAKIKRESNYTEEEKKKDDAFWDFIKKKSEEQEE